jgi:general secretion pathway protein F
MQQFTYTALDAAGRKQRGDTNAATEREALQALASQGLRVLLISEKHGGLANRPSAQIEGATKQLSAADVNLIVEELAVLLEAGVPLADATANLAQGRAGTKLQGTLDRLLRNLRGGQTLSACIAAEQSVLALPSHSLQLIRAGEETGQLAQSVRAVADQLAEDEQFAKEVTNALTYPAVLVLSGIAATALVFVFVVPKFANVLTNPKAQLPVLSQWILGAGLWFYENRSLSLAVAVGLGFAIALAWSQPTFRASCREAASRLPGVGGVLRQIDTARWANMLGVLLKNKVPMVDALRHASGALQLQAGAHAAAKVLVDVRGGAALSHAVGAHRLLDPIGQNLIRVGEQSGKLAETVRTLASMERRAVQQRLKRVLILLEPITILAISVVLGGIMISIMLAITSLSNLL